MALRPSICVICRRFWHDNKRGLYLKGHYICPDCEKRLVSLTRNDPDYENYILGLKKIWSVPGA